MGLLAQNSRITAYTWRVMKQAPTKANPDPGHPEPVLAHISLVTKQPLNFLSLINPHKP